MTKAKRNDRHLQQRKLIAAYAATGRIGEAAKAAGVVRENHYRWLDTDPAYHAAFEATQDQVAQMLEDEAIRRAKEGVKRPVMYKGAPVKIGRRILYEYEYSDTLLITLLKRFRPAVYRENVTTEVRGTIEIAERLQAARKRVLELTKKDDPTKEPAV